MVAPSEDVIDRPEGQYNADCGGKSKTGKPDQPLVFFPDRVVIRPLPGA